MPRIRLRPLPRRAVPCRRLCGPLTAGVLLLALAACNPAVPHEPARGPNLRAEVITVHPKPPKTPPAGQCWGSDTIPAVIETVTRQTLVSPEVRDAQGHVVKPAVWRSVSTLHMVQNRSAVWFRVPCPDTETTDFWASVQRALKARGYYLQRVTGKKDSATAEAVRRYQAEHGLDSPILSLAAAQDLGLIAVPPGQL